MTLNDIQRRIKRSKQSERDLGHWMLKNDGPDPHLRGIASSTGRVGHITSLQYDVVSATYCSENKQVKLPAKMLQWFVQIVDIANSNGKEALLRIEPTNVMVGLRKKSPVWHVITEDRHSELLRKEKEYDGVAEDAWKYRDLSDG